MITKEVKDKWLRLLRSSRYKHRKIKKALVEERGGKLCYCALGLFERAYGSKIVESKVSGGTVVSFDDAMFDLVLEDYHSARIIEMNDVKDLSFREIADWVEENVRATGE